MAHPSPTTTPSGTASPDAMFDQNHRLMEEVQRLHRNIARRPDGFELGVRWHESGVGVEYLYRQGQLICRAADLVAALDAFDAIGQPRPEVTAGPANLRVLEVGDRDAADLAEALAAALGRDDLVTPNHVLDSQVHSAMCPATEPVPSDGPVRDLPEPVGDRRVGVAVVDTGFVHVLADEAGYARFSAVSGDSRADAQVYADGTDRIEPYGGHGTAAAACLLAVSGAESTAVHVDSCLVGGAVDEVTVVGALTSAVESGADVVSLQAGMYTREHVASVAFAAFRDEVLAAHPDTVVVAAAGNNSSDEKFWPAAFDWVTGVGGLTEDGSARADWSNHGDWVDVYAPGDDVTVPFPNGTYEYHGGVTAEFTGGHAVWSGTSFATPAVAGLIARRMIEDGIDAPAARDRVLAEAAASELAGVGPRLLAD
ncbi:S8 family peptidase [Jiangella alkaliphila]|uniref:Subtilase family protein n=1 Tax=Jiangella alkaliphila TaxID=419479 RepID=A0A1H2ILC6_9ACTN|nr:S8/S53 family peptidase [Jiangella alkaliphila]SDU44785.1 Subtilase family protein [Jiangella alkaliphila]